MLGAGLFSFLQGVGWLEWSQTEAGAPEGLEGSPGGGWVWAQASLAPAPSTCAALQGDRRLSRGWEDGAGVLLPMSPLPGCLLRTRHLVGAAAKATPCHGWALLTYLLGATHSDGQPIISSDQWPHPGREPMLGDRSHQPRGTLAPRAPHIWEEHGAGNMGDHRLRLGLMGQRACTRPLVAAFLAWQPLVPIRHLQRTV